VLPVGAYHTEVTARLFEIGSSTMKAQILSTMLIAATSMAASSAAAFEGAYDGVYELQYENLDITVTCGDVTEQRSFDLDNEEVTAEAFSTVSDDLYARIQSRDLPGRLEEVAYKAADGVVEGMALALNNVVLTYPDTLDIAGLAGNSEVYAFLAGIEDEDFSTDEYQLSYTSVGYMDNGLFEGIPLEITIPAESLGELSAYISLASGYGQVLGEVLEDGEGGGELVWGAHLVSTGAIAGEVIDCQVHGISTFVMGM